MHHRFTISVLGASALWVAGCAAGADPAPATETLTAEPEGKPWKAAAKAACADAAEGDACAFEHGGDTIEGTCLPSRKDGALKCKSERHMHKHGKHGKHKRGWHKHMAEAKQACAESAEGDACSFETERGTKEGICRPSRRDEGTLVCRRVPPPEAKEACADKAEGDECSFETDRGTKEGVCAVSRHDDAMVCKHRHRGRHGRGGHHGRSHRGE
jgi:hypothetical protein